MPNDMAMPSIAASLYHGDYPTGGVLPASYLLLANLTLVEQVVEITPEGDEHGTVNITHLNSPDSAIEKISGWIDARTLSCRQNYTETRRAALEVLRPNPLDSTAARGRKAWVYVFPDGAAYMCLGFIGQIGANIPAASVNEPIITPFTIVLSGKGKFVDVA